MSLLDETSKLVSRSTVLMDTNLQILNIIGNINPEWIPRHKRTSTFTTADFDLLSRLSSRAKAQVTTPHVLTEISNLIAHGLKQNKRQLFLELAKQLELLPEQFIDAGTLSKHPAFLDLGLTDAGIIQLEIPDLVVVTTDLDLCTELTIHQIENINFNHLRAY